ncbi:MAG: hypothetical protein LRY73_14135 [Bacillus sp. (in: Bacteria)]|nr:hypothetical protein [Bacillus sp. (in: firmicutes)]
MAKTIICKLMLLFLIFISACTTDEKFPYPELLPEEGIPAHVIIIISNETISFDVPSYMKEYAENKISLSTIQQDSFNSKYPKIKVIEVPYFMYLDSKGIMFQTNDESEFEEFYLGNSK